MTTPTLLLNVGLAAGLSALVAAAMIVVPNLDRIRLVERSHPLSSDLREPQPAYGAALQNEPGSPA